MGKNLKPMRTWLVHITLEKVVGARTRNEAKRLLIKELREKIQYTDKPKDDTKPLVLNVTARGI